MRTEKTPVGSGTASQPAEDGGTEKRIFDSALHVFARKGQDGARMQEIADHAQINRALLHYYFRSKSQLYEAVFEHGFNQFISGLTPSLKTEQRFEDTLRVFVHGYIDYIHRHQEMARLMLNECLCGGPVLASYLTRALGEPGTFPGMVMQDRLREAVEAGEIRPVDIEHTMLTIVSACLFPFVALPTVRIFHPEAEGDLERFVDERKRHIVDLLLEGLRPSVGERGDG
ncbi:MAG: TetR/AcrR family transcriptional regulator [Gemmatimonadota bacterium]|nr:TetR/AcrR family transcriptional regulator [Gemmatimonadota bacterium]